ncbi:MAG: hypothetical protein ABI461_23305, partial [Polyangiaceae bacterium]
SRMTPGRPPQTSLLLSLGAFALLPFALLCCNRSSSDAAPAATSPESKTSVAATVDVGSPSATTPSQPASATSASASASSKTPSGAKAKCEKARTNVGKVIAQSLTCKVDADCTEINTSCGLPGVCGVAIAKGAESKIEVAVKPWNDLNCWAVTAAACPSCFMPPPPRCVAGKCD